MSDGVPESGRRRAALGFIFITIVLDMFALGLVIPVLPHLVEDFMGGDTAGAARVYGLFGTVWALMQFLSMPVMGALSDRLRAGAELFEGKMFAELAELLPDGALVYVGNSMPVRDLEVFWPAGPVGVRFLCNHGANGIDGMLSSGRGAAAVAPGPVVVVTGDLGFYHDMNGLLAAKRYGLDALIIVLNNDGGGIFSFLPQAACGPEFEEFFATPHGLDFRHAAALYEGHFTRVGSWAEFRSAVRTGVDASGLRIIEVPTVDRQRNVELHRAMWSAVSDALRGG